MGHAIVFLADGRMCRNSRIGGELGGQEALETAGGEANATLFGCS